MQRTYSLAEQLEAHAGAAGGWALIVLSFEVVRHPDLKPRGHVADTQAGLRQAGAWRAILLRHSWTMR